MTHMRDHTTVHFSCRLSWPLHQDNTTTIVVIEKNFSVPFPAKPCQPQNVTLESLFYTAYCMRYVRTLLQPDDEASTATYVRMYKNIYGYMVLHMCMCTF